MKDVTGDFESFGERIWLNAGSEGPLPKVAARALQESINWKSLPFHLDNQKFIDTTLGLKKSIGTLISVSERDVILGTSASYGLHILANGIQWQPGDEIILMENDFPTNILPWLALEDIGVKVIQIRPKNKILHPDEFLSAISSRTKLFCISHVHTFTGYVLDVKAFSEICRKNNILFVVNLSQSAGNMPVNVASLGAHAVVTAGYKWLCGPYGAGFCWIDPKVRDDLKLNLAYWVALCSEDELKSEGPIKRKEIHTARKYDIFGTANFFNFVPFKASIDYLLSIGIDEIFQHNQKLIDDLLTGLDQKKYELISPQKENDRSCLVVISHKEKDKNKYIFSELKKKLIYPAFWKGNIRFAPHLYNTKHDIQKLIKVLNTF